MVIVTAPLVGMAGGGGVEAGGGVDDGAVGDSDFVHDAPASVAAKASATKYFIRVIVCSPQLFEPGFFDKAG
jgi:hypothetical protein